MLADPASTYPWDPLRKDFYGGRVGIVRTSIALTFDRAMKPSPFNPDHTFEQDIGNAPFPVGEKTGLKPNTLCTTLIGFSAGLSKEQLKLAFEWYDWSKCGRGATLWLTEVKDKIRLLGKEAYPARALGGYVYKIREFPPGFPKAEDMIPKEFLDLFAKEKMTPLKPRPQQFGLKYNIYAMPSEELPYIQALNQKIVSEENLDIKAELEKIADSVNKEALNYKIKGDKEKFQRYYAAVEKFFKENYPTFYESDMFKEIWEKYYKVF